MADIEVPISSLRWPIVIARRRQTPDPAGAGIVEILEHIQPWRADVQSVGALTFWGAAGGDEQIDTPVTHRIRMRWLNYLDNTLVILRQTKLLDKTVRMEIFRIRRIKELNGRKRFVEIECELERSK